MTFQELQRLRTAAFAEQELPAEEAPVMPPASDAPPLPGSLAKIALLRDRVAEGKPIHQRGDIIHHPRRVIDQCRRRNGHAPRAEARRILEVPESEPEEQVLRQFNTCSQRRVRTIFQLAPRTQLADRLKQLRKSRKLSLGQVSLVTGISRSTILKIEQGKHPSPHLPVLWRLAEAFGVSIDWLVGREK